ncbi:MAG: hypothetical protein LUD84_09975 [Clostridiales bacterium]|nr:hypothetical protein [Clostridiales bacterium]
MPHHTQVSKKYFLGDSSGADVTAAVVQGIREELPNKPETGLAADNVSVAIAVYVKTVAPMDEESKTLFHKLAKRLLEQGRNGEDDIGSFLHILNCDVVMEKQPTRRIRAGCFISVFN